MHYKEPKVTVLMPVYNGETYLKEAIESILNQTYLDFEFLIINDGSTDSSEKIIQSYTDKRIRLVNNTTNLKLITTLNKGIDLARGEYIVRMDCDDISLPERLAVQVEYMDKNPQIGLSGAFINVFYGGSNSLFPNILKFPITNEEIKANLIFQSSFAHPTVIMRRHLLNLNKLRYDMDYIHAEDYKLWVDCSKYFKLGNISQVLLLYRRNINSISVKHRIQQAETSFKISKEVLERYEFKYMKEFEEVFMDIARQKDIKTNQLERIQFQLLSFLEMQNEKAFFAEDILKKSVGRAWFTICNNTSYMGPKIFLTFINSRLGKSVDKVSWPIVKFFIKCILKK